MWWCCGKRGKEMPGCKFGKHEFKEEEEDEKTKEEVESLIGQQLRNVRCFCCKEIGHTTSNCQRDPNFKTKADIETDAGRLNMIKDQKKLHSDTLISTTHFIKKSVMIPVDWTDDGVETHPPNISHPFMRGIMTFDDYNYR
jgi:hypothetical protein